MAFRQNAKWSFCIESRAHRRSFVRRRPLQSAAVVYLENGLPWNHQVYPNVNSGRVYKRTGHDITIYFRL